MRRLLVSMLLLLAAILAVEPLLHEHPLQSNEAVICAACAAGSGQVAVFRPTVSAPVAVAYRLVASAVIGHSFETPRSVPSRAPPAL